MACISDKISDLHLCHIRVYPPWPTVSSLTTLDVFSVFTSTLLLSRPWTCCFSLGLRLVLILHMLFLQVPCPGFSREASLRSFPQWQTEFSVLSPKPVLRDRLPFVCFRRNLKLCQIHHHHHIYPSFFVFPLQWPPAIGEVRLTKKLISTAWRRVLPTS